MPRRKKSQDDQPVIYYYIGQRIYQERLRQNINQTELAQRVGIARTSLTNIENGNQHLPIGTLYRIAMALGCEPGQLLPAASEKILKTEHEAFLDFLNSKE